jgi:DNA replication initiation complex subunit (GINS family)
MQQNQNQSTAERLLKKAQESADRQALSKEEFAELKKACRAIFTTKYGQIVARTMMRVSGIYTVPKNSNNLVAMGEERGREFMYLFFVKSMLSSESIQLIEKGD